jgi:hypothetical protein
MPENINAGTGSDAGAGAQAKEQADMTAGVPSWLKQQTERIDKERKEIFGDQLPLVYLKDGDSVTVDINVLHEPRVGKYRKKIFRAKLLSSGWLNMDGKEMPIGSDVDLSVSQILHDKICPLLSNGQTKLKLSRAGEDDDTRYTVEAV